MWALPWELQSQSLGNAANAVALGLILGGVFADKLQHDPAAAANTSDEAEGA